MTTIAATAGSHLCGEVLVVYIVLHLALLGLYTLFYSATNKLRSENKNTCGHSYSNRYTYFYIAIPV